MVGRWDEAGAMVVEVDGREVVVGVAVAEDEDSAELAV